MRWLFTLAIIPIVGCASPQRPCCKDFNKVDAEPAREASDRFLAALDEEKYEASWEHISGELQDAFSRRTWASKMRSQRLMLGAAEIRERKGTGYMAVPIKFVGDQQPESEIPFSPGWSFDRESIGRDPVACESLPLSIHYKSAYAIAGRVFEKVLLRREEGVWRVVVYAYKQSHP